MLKIKKQAAIINYLSSFLTETIKPTGFKKIKVLTKDKQ